MVGLMDDTKLFKKSYVTWRLIGLFFEQQTSNCFVCKNWTLRDKIKMAIDKPDNWRYFSIRDLYRYTDTQIVFHEEASPEVELKDAEIIDYYTIDAKHVKDSIRIPDLITDSESDIVNPIDESDETIESD